MHFLWHRRSPGYPQQRFIEGFVQSINVSSISVGLHFPTPALRLWILSLVERLTGGSHQTGQGDQHQAMTILPNQVSPRARQPRCRPPSAWGLACPLATSGLRHGERFTLGWRLSCGKAFFAPQLAIRGRAAFGLGDSGGHLDSVQAMLLGDLRTLGEALEEVDRVSAPVIGDGGEYSLLG